MTKKTDDDKPNVVTMVPRIRKPLQRVIDVEPDGTVLSLTDKQEAFAIATVENGGNFSSAYRQVYNVENMAPQTIYVKAHELKSNPKVAERIRQIAKERHEHETSDPDCIKAFVLTRLNHEALHAKSDSARVRSLELLGKVDYVGLFKDKDAPREPLRGEEIEQRLRKMLGMDGGE